MCFYSRQGQKVFLSFKVFRVALMPTHRIIIRIVAGVERKCLM